jgi:hypothetical protein
METGCFLCDPCQGVILKKIWANQLVGNCLLAVSCEFSSAWEAVKIEPEETQLLDAIARKRLMETQQAGKRFNGC